MLNHDAGTGLICPATVFVAGVVADVPNLYPLLHFFWQTFHLTKEFLL